MHVHFGKAERELVVIEQDYNPCNLSSLFLVGHGSVAAKCSCSPASKALPLAFKAFLETRINKGGTWEEREAQKATAHVYGGQHLWTCVDEHHGRQISQTQLAPCRWAPCLLLRLGAHLLFHRFFSYKA